MILPICEFMKCVDFEYSYLYQVTLESMCRFEEGQEPSAGLSASALFFFLLEIQLSLSINKPTLLTLF
jgi:hypothetical protein